MDIGHWKSLTTNEKMQKKLLVVGGADSNQIF